MITLDELRRNIDIVKARVDAALKNSGRNGGVTIVGASKTMPREVIELVDEYRLLDVLGENRVQELVLKCAVKEHVRWHMIGTLQTNKVKQVVGNVAMIESLDRFALAHEIDKQGARRGLVSDCLIQVNMGREESKSGFFAEETERAIERIVNDYKAIRVRGLMAVMPIAGESQVIALYKELKDLYYSVKDKYALDTLSAGMTNDYHLAIEYAHSNTVRIGRAIFGERCYGSEEIRSKTQTD